MIRHFTISEILDLHARIMARTGGSEGLRDLGALESALAQPHMTFAEQDLYPTLADKAAALAFSLVLNHPFIDGNKRTGHAVMEVFLFLNGREVNATIEEQERTFRQLAAGRVNRESFAIWLRDHIQNIQEP